MELTNKYLSIFNEATMPFLLSKNDIKTRMEIIQTYNNLFGGTFRGMFHDLTTNEQIMNCEINICVKLGNRFLNIGEFSEFLEFCDQFYNISKLDYLHLLFLSNKFFDK